MLYTLSCRELVDIWGSILNSCFRCSTHRKFKPRNMGAIPLNENNPLCNGFQITQLVIRNFFHLDLLFLSRSCCLLLFVLRNLPTNALPLFYFLRKCIKSNRLQMIFVSVYEDIKDLLSASRKIWWENQKRNKNDKIPRARVWTLTTDRNMVQSDALPTELRGTCRHLKLNFKVMF